MSPTTGTRTDLTRLAAAASERRVETAVVSSEPGAVEPSTRAVAADAAFAAEQSRWREAIGRVAADRAASGRSTVATVVSAGVGVLAAIGAVWDSGREPAAPPTSVPEPEPVAGPTVAGAPPQESVQAPAWTQPGEPSIVRIERHPGEPATAVVQTAATSGGPRALPKDLARYVTSLPHASFPEAMSGSAVLPPAKTRAVDLARRFMGEASASLRGRLPHFLAAGGQTNNCADFVSAVLRGEGLLQQHYVWVPALEQGLKREGYDVVPATQAAPGDVFVHADRMHVQLVTSPGGARMIGSNNNGRAYQSITEGPVVDAGVYYQKRR